MTLQEYLIKLGWSVDEPSLKKFVGAVSATGSRVAELGSVAIETAAAIELMVSRVARTYETLYYASQRTGQSIRYIQSTQFAFKQIGLSAEEANASIEGIATTLRTQTWLRAIFGNANTPQQVATNLGRSGLPYFLQVKFAEMIGMSEKTLFHMQKFGEIEAKAQADFVKRQREAGVDPERLANQSVEFGRALNKLESDLEIFGDRMAADFIQPVTTGITKLDEIVQWVNRADVATKGWISTLGTIAGSAGGLILVEKILRKLLGASPETASGKVAGLVAKRALGVRAGGGLIGSAIGVAELVKEDNPETKTMLRSLLGPAFYAMGLSKSPDLNGTSGGGSGGGGSKQQRIAQAVAFFKEAGFPDEAAKGITAGLFSESGLDPSNTNPTSGAYGIAQHLGPRLGKFKEVFGKDIHGSSFEDQLKYVLWELTRGGEQATGKALLQGGFSARQGAGMFIHGFERPGAAGEASDMSRAGPLADALSSLVPQQNAGSTKNVTLHSTAHINISGSPDAMSTAKQYTDAHNNVNDNMIRQFTPAVR
jgi:hypothetical protein